jgi:hypothetical protein
LPLEGDVNLIDFEVTFEKEKKKSMKGLYKIKFFISEDNINNLRTNDIEFLCAGFL